MIIDKNSDSSVDLVDWLRRSSDESENLARTNMLSSARISDVYKLTGEKQVLDILYDEETGRLTIVYKDGSTVSIYLPTDGGGCDCDLSEYVKSSDLEAEISELESKIPTSTSGLTNDSDFVSQTQVDERIKEVVGAAPEALDTLQEISKALGDDANFASTITNQITEVKSMIPSVEGLASETYVNEQISNIEIPSIEGLATVESVESAKSDIEKWVAEQGYLTEHQDISGLATKEEVKAVEDKIPSIEGLLSSADAEATYQPKGDYATKDDIKDSVNYQHFGEGRKTIQLANHDTISGIATDGTGHNLAMLSKWDVADFGAVGVHMNLNTKDNVTINDSDVVATEKYVDEQIAAIEHPTVDLSGLATKEEIKDAVNYQHFGEGRKTVQLANHDTISGIDTKGVGHNLAMVSKWDVADFGAAGLHMNLNSSDKVTINDKDHVATEEWVSEQIGAIEHPTVDLTGYATEKWVEEKIAEAELDDVDPTTVVTKTELAEKTANMVEYSEFTYNGQTRKTIQLDNYDSISGVATTGEGHNLVMLSKWDVADFGATGVHMNLNTKDNVTINDNEVVATQSYVDEKVNAIEHPQVDLTPYAKSEDVTKEIAESAEATKTWVGEQGYLTEHQDISDVVRYKEYEGSKFIELKNSENITGLDTDGKGYNLVSVSKWNVAEVGSASLHSNINTSTTTALGTDAEGNNPYTDGLTIYDNNGNVVEDVPVVTVNDKFGLATLNQMMAIRVADAQTNAATYAKKSELPSVEGLAKEDWVEDKLTVLETKIPDENLLATKEEVEAKVDKESMATINGKSLINGGDITLDLTLYKVVESLPSDNIDVDKIYLVLSTESGVSDIYSEYIYVNGEWEKVGEYKATIDLTPYLKVEDAKNLYASKNEVDAKIAGVLTALQWKDSVATFADIAVVYPNPKEGDTVFVDDENTTYTFMDGEWIAVSANSIPQATEEYDGLMPASAMTEVKKISSIQGDVTSIEAKLSILESKISALSKTNIEVVAIDGSSVPLSDPTKDYSIQGVVTSNFTVSESKSITISDTEISNDAKLILRSSGEVELKGVTTSGEFTKTGSNCIVNIPVADSVVIKDMTILSSQYNGIEMGSGTTVPKSVIIDNCDFSGEFSNNAISIHGTQDDAIVNISNCKFSSVSNPLRISNKDGGRLTINVTNCSCDKWEEGKYAGFLLCQDFTSTSVEEAAEKNLFGSDKVTINFINFTMPGGVKLTKPEDLASICGTADNSQIAYVYRNAEAKADENYVVTPYGDGSAYPKINII